MAWGIGLVLAMTGCTSSGDDPSSYEPDRIGLPSPAASELSAAIRDEKKRWKPPAPANAQRTLKYLETDPGRTVTGASERIRDAESAMTGGLARGADRCQSFARQWDKDFPAQEMLVRVGGLRDRALIEAFGKQYDAVIAMVDYCQRGDLEQARKFARIGKAWYGVYQQRIRQLERAR